MTSDRTQARRNLTALQHRNCQHIIETGEAALLRLSAGNPMRSIIARNVTEAKIKLEGLA